MDENNNFEGMDEVVDLVPEEPKKGKVGVVLGLAAIGTAIVVGGVKLVKWVKNRKTPSDLEDEVLEDYEGYDDSYLEDDEDSEVGEESDEKLNNG